ncbi:TonB-dependent vitamin B12 receptor [Vibrio sinaloensis]|uniref:TonB-dependent vitamin B12 receptor n=1 Tax=Photobacterium sp. (strain ATCC 43367) TaxID=379097 RepID=UPI00206CB194|nr:TonB-dependent vitamin B12 receptor [Vibrio sinaloensis]UPQ87838.1 TonB-dependent vitamin B12 receptor [Vibrio sinaloensis]
MNRSILALAVTSLLGHASYSFATEISVDETIIVTANRFEQSTESVVAQVEVVTRADIERIQAKSITDVFQRLTGVQVSQNGGRGQQASIFVRGANSDQVLVLIDGIRFARAAKGGVDFSQLPIAFVERIEYVRGARAAMYGSEAIGGVINIITRASSDNDTTQVSAGLGSLDYQQLSAVSGVKVGEHGHLNLSVGYDADQGYNVRPVKGVNDQDRHGFESRNALIGYVHDFDSQWSGHANLRFFDNISQYDASYSTRDYKEAQVRNTTVAGGIKYQGDALTSQVLVNYQNQDNWNYTKDQGKHSTSAVADELQQTNFQWLANYQLNEAVVVNGGVDWRNEAYIVKPSDVEYDRNNTAVFAALNADYQQWFGELSLRVDDNQQFGSETTYNTGAGYRLGSWLVVKAAYGTSFKAPNLYQLYSYYGNQKLNAEKADSLELTLSGAVYGVDWSITGYDTNINNLIDYNFTTSKYYNSPGESQLRGVEIVAMFNTEWISHQLSADLKNPKDQSGKQLIRRAQEIYKYNALAQFNEFDVSLGYQYVGKRPDFSQELAAYGLFDLAVSYYANEHLTLNGRIENLSDEQYQTAAGYPAPERGYYLNAIYQF